MTAAPTRVWLYAVTSRPGGSFLDEREELARFLEGEDFSAGDCRDVRFFGTAELPQLSHVA
jgi:hypothetical protein